MNVPAHLYANVTFRDEVDEDPDDELDEYVDDDQMGWPAMWVWIAGFVCLASMFESCFGGK